MADRGDTNYNLPRLNLVFMLSAAVLLGCAVWMVLDDWDRSWKNHQRDYQALEYERAEQDLAGFEEDAEWVARRDALEAQVAQLEAQLGDDSDHGAAAKELRAAEGNRYRTETDFKIAKAVANWERFLLNQEKAAVGQGAADDSTYRAAQAELDRARREFEASEARYAEAEVRLNELSRARDEVESQLEQLTREAEMVANRKLAYSPGVFRALRNAPGLDFVAPTIQVRKQVLKSLRKNYNFTTVPRVDMCASCHAGIDDPNYTPDALAQRGAEADPVLEAHPRLDLFMSPGSPHPIESFGCTVCHDGASETLEFSRAVHTPVDHDQQEEWEEEHEWHHWHLWNWPMLPSKYAEAGCYSCHQLGDTLETIAPDAPKLSKGLQLMEQYGCYSCHKIEGWRTERKSGPSLRSIAAKVTPEFTRSWVRDPHQFRPSTWMPQIFHLENGVSPEWDDTTIAAVQAYLWDRSERPAVDPMPADVRAAADADRGEALLAQVGCTACHNAPGVEAHEFSEYAPDLAGIGTKLDPDWLYQWVLEPTSWWPETRMPDMRLEPQQAADIAVYLDTLTADGWEPIEVQVHDEELRQQALAFLQRRRTLEESESVYEQWLDEGGRQKVLVEVGEQWITRQGCYSCHDIPGFEQGMPIGTELSDWGNKNVHKLAFELWDEHVPGHHEGAVAVSRFAFSELKLSNPRRFDRGLEIAPLDRLRMPEFKLDPDEIEAITTVMLGLKDERELILEAARPQPDLTAATLERGSYLVRQKNCYGCHKFDLDTVTATIEFGDGTLTKPFHGIVTLEDDDEEATYMQLWKTDPDLAAEEGGGGIGEVAELLWEYNDDEPWEIVPGPGGGIMAGLAEYYASIGDVGDSAEAFPLLPPILYREGEKVRAPWLTQFLLAPYTLRPWLVVRMPTFTLSEADARDLSLYFAALSRKEWPARYARALRSGQEMGLAEFSAETGIAENMLRDIESGGRHSANAFQKLQAWGAAQGFEFDPAPVIPFEDVRERSPVYLAQKEAEVPQYLDRAAALVGKSGIDCYACHIRDGQDPGGDKLSWGPDLAYSKDRLRPDWIRAWVTDAQKIYPGTKMPTASGFVADPKLQEILQGSSAFLIEAIKDFLMNSDRTNEEGDSFTLLDRDARTTDPEDRDGAGGR